MFNSLEDLIHNGDAYVNLRYLEYVVRADPVEDHAKLITLAHERNFYIFKIFINSIQKFQ